MLLCKRPQSTGKVYNLHVQRYICSMRRSGGGGALIGFHKKEGGAPTHTGCTATDSKGEMEQGNGSVWSGNGQAKG